LSGFQHKPFLCGSKANDDIQDTASGAHHDANRQTGDEHWCLSNHSGGSVGCDSSKWINPLSQLLDEITIKVTATSPLSQMLENLTCPLQGHYRKTRKEKK
jgi:hypothetical protein